MSEFQTILYEETDGVAWVTLNRPESHNAFNDQMQRSDRGRIGLFVEWTSCGVK